MSTRCDGRGVEKRLNETCKSSKTLKKQSGATDPPYQTDRSNETDKPLTLGSSSTSPSILSKSPSNCPRSPNRKRFRQPQDCGIAPNCLDRRLQAQAVVARVVSRRPRFSPASVEVLVAKVRPLQPCCRGTCFPRVPECSRPNSFRWGWTDSTPHADPWLNLK